MNPAHGDETANAVARPHRNLVFLVLGPLSISHCGTCQPSTCTVTNHQNFLFAVSLLLLVSKIRRFFEALQIPSVSISGRLGLAQIKIWEIQ